MQTHVTPTRCEPLPETLDSPQAKLVYLYLTTSDGATVDDLADALSMRKLSVLSVLRSLSADGLVEREGDRVRARN
ncbi:helix-turn-helix domain-containing protein [Halovivax sp.]|uniref:helix-turn-helix domain-containing protein n=1 Tax=Halovivax sp. TaxID=1935978 RepID=UPI0025BE9B4A|nr:helix-turn-helix domain-containing protein [Halovivax sp.]